MFLIGSWAIQQPTILAPMAGVTDQPFRKICRQLGAGLAVSEMVTSDTSLWSSRKSLQRLAHKDEIAPRAVQLAGNDPDMMALAARANSDMGAQIIDINMGCPAKKVCKKAAGSALLADEALVERILTSVVKAVDIPVTLKIRTGSNEAQRNGVAIAKIAEGCGVQSLAVHGRTRACAFKGDVEYDTIASIVDTLSIPVIANGDIRSPQQAKHVLNYTGATGVMIGRGAQGNPWIFREVNYFLEHGSLLAKPTDKEFRKVVLDHINALHMFYGEYLGIKIARKHVSWYLQYHAQLMIQTMVDAGPNNTEHDPSEKINQDYLHFRKAFNQIESAQEQIDHLLKYFDSSFIIEEKAA